MLPERVNSARQPAASLVVNLTGLSLSGASQYARTLPLQHNGALVSVTMKSLSYHLPMLKELFKTENRVHHDEV